MFLIWILPSCKKEDVSLKLEDGCLTVGDQRAVDKDEKMIMATISDVRDIQTVAGEAFMYAQMFRRATLKLSLIH